MTGKQKLLIIAFLVMVSGLNRCTVKDGSISRMKLFDLNWKFSLGNDSPESDIDDRNQRWQSIDLPHDWNKDDTLKSFIKTGSENGKMKFGWYRKQFEIPEDWKGKSIEIDFEGICQQSEVFLNGTLIKQFKRTDNSFQANINPYLNEQGINIITVRVAAPEPSITGTFPDAGIFKHVWLVIRESPE